MEGPSAGVDDIGLSRQKGEHPILKADVVIGDETGIETVVMPMRPIVTAPGEAAGPFRGVQMPFIELIVPDQFPLIARNGKKRVIPKRLKIINRRGD
jgi:hypothetical protein